MRYWLIPPKIYRELDAEFNFDFDPCPYPKKDWDGLKVGWGRSNWVNPPFLNRDGGPPTKWLRKAIHELSKGNTTVMIVSIAATAKEFWKVLLESGVIYQLRYLKHHYIDVRTQKTGRYTESLIFVFKKKGG